jgi:hypothetical protein
MHAVAKQCCQQVDMVHSRTTPHPTITYVFKRTVHETWNYNIHLLVFATGRNAYSLILIYAFCVDARYIRSTLRTTSNPTSQVRIKYAC